MVRVIEISPENEMPVANKLAREIRHTWPDVAISPTEHVTIIVGFELGREIDLVVVVRLQTPRPLPAMMRRDGTMSAPDYVQGAVLLIEVKQLPPECFTVVGTEIFAVRGGNRDRESVGHQARSASFALRDHLRRYGYDRFFVYALGWLTEVGAQELAEVNPWIVGNHAKWYGMLDAAGQKNADIYQRRAPEYLDALERLVEILTLRRAVSPLDRKRALALRNDELADPTVPELAALAGTKMIRITGPGGSGKTTTLALLAKRLATIGSELDLIVIYEYVQDKAIADRVIADFRMLFVGLEFSETEQTTYDAAVAELARVRRTLSDRFPVLEDAQNQADAVKLLVGGEQDVDARLSLGLRAERRRLLSNSSARHAFVEWCARRGLFAGKRTIVFHQSIADCESIVAAMRAAGISAAAHHSELKSTQRADVLRRFRDGDLSVLVAPRTLDEGIDVPDVSLALIAAGTRVKRQTIQRIGRVLRRALVKDAAKVVNFTYAAPRAIPRRRTRILTRGPWLRGLTASTSDGQRTTAITDFLKL